MVGGRPKVRVVDPQGRHKGGALLPGVVWTDDAHREAFDADLAVIITAWIEFRALDPKRLAQKVARARLTDLRNIWVANGRALKPPQAFAAQDFQGSTDPLIHLGQKYSGERKGQRPSPRSDFAQQNANKCA